MIFTPSLRRREGRGWRPGRSGMAKGREGGRWKKRKRRKMEKGKRRKVVKGREGDR